MQIKGVVKRTFTADKFGKLTLEYQGDGKYPDFLDCKTFDRDIIGQLKKLGNGETVTIDFALQTEKVNVDGKDIVQTGKDGKEYPVKVPMIKIKGLSVEGQGTSNGPGF